MENIVLSEEKIKKYKKKFRSATLMDDMKFRKVCESKEAIQEILRVVLRDNNLKVLESLKQRSEEEPIFHGVILDCRCKLKTGEIVNIEVQVASNDNPIYRMRYNEAMLTIENSPKSKIFKYKNIPKIILIMFCEFDIFSIRKPIYEIDRIVRGTKIKADDGVREIYVNLKAKATDKKLKSLFKIMTTIKEVDDKTFPTLSRKKIEINDMYIGGDRNMAGLDLMMYKDGLREGRAEGREEGRAEGVQQGVQQGEISAIVKLYKNGLIKIEDAIKMLNISNEKFLQLIK